jgi:hypothetical protein
MSLYTESPRFTDALPPTENSTAPDPAGRFPGRVRGQRLEITAADLTMYSAITGRAPSVAERERALTWSESDPMHAEIADATAGEMSSSSSSTSTAVVPLRAMRAWHPMALSLRLREIWFNGLTLRVPRLQITQWMQRLSLALYSGRRRVRHVQRRDAA